ncbi:MAG TPA: YlbF family regulator [Firmicutes bacterium]|nr:YlbF family regulator [Bacillota bacterium]
MDIIQATRELGKLIQASDEYKRLRAAREANDQDSELEALIGEFNLKKLEIERLLAEENRDQEKVTAANTAAREVYGKIMSRATMMEYNEASQAVNSLMTYITQILSLCVNGEDPDTCEPAPSCGGSCDSCSGCH